MSFDRAGLARRLFLPALLVLATAVFAQQPSQGQPQSLGDAARQFRAERQQSGPSRRVYTNDDLAGPSAGGAQATSAGGGDQAAQGEAASAGKAAEGSAAASDQTGKKDETAKKKEEELQKRAQDVNQQYLDKIAGIRTQMDAAKKELERLQRDQVESSNHFRSSNGISPTISEYESQQRSFEQQIETQRNLIGSLNSQLEDAQEAARHAGVRASE